MHWISKDTMNNISTIVMFVKYFMMDIWPGNKFLQIARRKTSNTLHNLGVKIRDIESIKKILDRPLVNNTIHYFYLL